MLISFLQGNVLRYVLIRLLFVLHDLVQAVLTLLDLGHFLRELSAVQLVQKFSFSLLQRLVLQFPLLALLLQGQYLLLVELGSSSCCSCGCTNSFLL
jgi:hypothetical protein